MAEATRMREMLGHCQANALDAEYRSGIQKQRIIQNEAFAKYQQVRARLIDAARAGFENS
jgi:hypothetical protein